MLGSVLFHNLPGGDPWSPKECSSAIAAREK